MTAIDTTAASDARTTPFTDLSASVNDVVQRYPNTLPVFAAYGLDTCCRGNMSIEDAASDAGIEPAVLADALRATVQQAEPAILNTSGVKAAPTCGCR